MTPEKISECPCFCRTGPSPLFSLSLVTWTPHIVSDLVHLYDEVQPSRGVNAFCSAAHTSRQPSSQHGGRLPGLCRLSKCLLERLLHRTPLFGRWLLEKWLWNPFHPLCDKVRRLSVFFRRLSSRRPMLLPCGAVSHSTSWAASGFSTQPWALEATPVSCCYSSSCRQRQKAIRHPNRWSLRLCER